MRRFTFITLVCLFLVLTGAAVYQFALANRDAQRYPGPVVGTPLPPAVASP